MSLVLNIENLSKQFTLHQNNSVSLPVLSNIQLALHSGEYIGLVGPSGIGKSTLLRMIYGNYHCASGSIHVKHCAEWLDITTVLPRIVLDMRRQTIGFVRQFLHVLPRVSTLDIVSEPLVGLGFTQAEIQEKASLILRRLNIPQVMWQLSPLTFSGGEQQRVNIAKTFIADYPVLLLDEPTASLDEQNKQEVLKLIEEAVNNGCAILGVFHDQSIKDAICSRIFDLEDAPAP